MISDAVMITLISSLTALVTTALTALFNRPKWRRQDATLEEINQKVTPRPSPALEREVNPFPVRPITDQTPRAERPADWPTP